MFRPQPVNDAALMVGRNSFLYEHERDAWSARKGYMTIATLSYISDCKWLYRQLDGLAYEPHRSGKKLVNVIWAGSENMNDWANFLGYPEHPYRCFWRPYRPKEINTYIAFQ